MRTDITQPDPHAADWFDAAEPEGDQQAVNPLLVVHRCLRGRYLLAILLAGVLAVPCAVLGYMAVPPKYTSVGVVNIKPTRSYIIYQNELNEPLSAYDSYLQSQANVLRSFPVMSFASGNEDLLAKGWPRGPRGIIELDRGLQVAAPSRGQDIFVSVTHEDPTLAMAAVDALLAAYKAKELDKENQRLRDTMTELAALRDDYRDERNEAEAEVRAIADEEGTDDLESRRDAKHQHWARLEALIDEYRLELVRYGNTANDPEPASPDELSQQAGPTTEELAAVDPELAGLLQQRAQVRAEIEVLRKRFTEEHRAVTSAKADLETIEALIVAREHRVLESWTDETGSVSASRMSAAQIKNQIRTLEQLRDETQKEAMRLGQSQLRIDGFRRAAARAEEQLKLVESRLEAFDVETRNGQIGRITVGDASFPYRPSTDRRVPLAAIGALGGGGVGVALVAALGFFYPKYRYIDDIEEATRNVFVFGAIPELDPTNPESRQLVAASIHQVRSVIDARLLGTSRRATVHVVTSAGAAEGKSTVSLRLAKSFAATGRRTLLIDSDMIGRRLTSEFGLLDHTGFADAVTASDEPGQTVYETPIRDLSIMPCGRTDRVDPEEISAGRAETLLAPLQEIYGAIVIDTGPVLGSLEAQAIAPVADEVMLVVTRGREVRNVKMAIDRLHRLGSRKIGVVFNRATRADIERSTSISATSQRATEARNQWHDSHDDHRANGQGAVARLESASEREA